MPALAERFPFAPLAGGDLALCAFGAALGITWFEVVKLAGRRPQPAAPHEEAKAVCAPGPTAPASAYTVRAAGRRQGRWPRRSGTLR